MKNYFKTILLLYLHDFYLRAFDSEKSPPNKAVYHMEHNIMDNLNVIQGIYSNNKKLLFMQLF